MVDYFVGVENSVPRYQAHFQDAHYFVLKSFAWQPRCTYVVHQKMEIPLLKIMYLFFLLMCSSDGFTNFESMNFSHFNGLVTLFILM